MALLAVSVTACGASLDKPTSIDTLRLGTETPQRPDETKIGAIKERDRAAARKAVKELTAAATPGSVAYKIGPLDVVEITVFKVPELSKAIQVSESGTINYPLIGEVVVGSKTAREVEHILTKKLGAKYLQKPQVTVFVKEYNSQRVTIEGAVKKPGVYPIKGGMTLMQAIAVAQGLEETAENTIVVFRDANGKRAIARFEVAALRGGTAKDPQLQAGDVIVVETSALKQGFNQFIKMLPLVSVFALL